MMMFIGFPVTRPRLVIRASILRMPAVSLIGHYMLLTYTERLHISSYIIYLLYLKLL